jgi:hypothetical protein
METCIIDKYGNQITLLLKNATINISVPLAYTCPSDGLGEGASCEYEIWFVEVNLGNREAVTCDFFVRGYLLQYTATDTLTFPLLFSKKYYFEPIDEGGLM